MALEFPPPNRNNPAAAVFGVQMIRTRPRKLILAVAVLAMTLIVPAYAAKVRTIDGGRDFGPPSCPTPAKEQKREAQDANYDIPDHKECNVFGHVTGFQLRTDSNRAVHKVPANGKLVAWSVDLADPRSNPKNDTLVDERGFFESKLSDETFDNYGSRPVANIEVLKKKGKGRFKLTKKSPIVELDPWLGDSPIFTLKKPLRVRKGRVVALSTPTWVPNFALAEPGGNGSLSEQNKWRGSRKPGSCVGEDTDGDGVVDDDSNLTSGSKPQVRKGSTKKYGCVYSGAQILYSAFLVADKKGGKKGGGKQRRRKRRRAVSAAAGSAPTIEIGGGLAAR